MALADNLMLRCEEAIVRAERLRDENDALKARSRHLTEMHGCRVTRGLQILAAMSHHRRARLPASAQSFADHMTAQLQTVALVEQRVASGAEAIPIRDFVSDVCANLPGAADPSIRLRLTADSFLMPPEPCTTIGLIVAELVINSYQHAFRENRGGDIRVTLRRSSPERAWLNVSDTGPGLRSPFEKRAGLIMVEALAASLGGEVSYREGEGGVRVTFST